MILDEKTLHALANEEFVLECKEIEFTPTSPGPEKSVHIGPGSISQTHDSTFLVKAYCQGSIHPKNVVAPFLARTPGRLIDDAEYYIVSAKDFKGNIWNSDPVLPRFISGLDFNDYIVEAYCKKLTTQVKFPTVPEGNPISIIYRGKITIPSNTVTKTETKIGDRIEKQGYNLNVAKFNAAGLEFEIDSDPYWLRMYVTSSNIPNDFPTVLRISEALQFVLGQTLSWTCIEIWDKDIQTTIVSAAPRNEKRSRIQPPLAFGAVDKDGSSWLLFDKYLAYVLDYKKEGWHPIFQRIHSVFESGEASIEARGLTLSVAIEALLKEAFPLLAMPSVEDRKNISEAKDIIRNSSIANKIKERLNGFIGTMSDPRAKDRLFVLRDAGVIDKRLTDTWESLRNPSTHGDVPDWRDLQKYIDKCASALTLFYQLIFLAIEYTGKYTNYSCEEYPIEVFEKKLP